MWRLIFWPPLDFLQSFSCLHVVPVIPVSSIFSLFANCTIIKIFWTTEMSILIMLILFFFVWSADAPQLIPLDDIQTLSLYLIIIHPLIEDQPFWLLCAMFDKIKPLFPFVVHEDCVRYRASDWTFERKCCTTCRCDTDKWNHARPQNIVAAFYDNECLSLRQTKNNHNKILYASAALHHAVFMDLVV